MLALAAQFGIVGLGKHQRLGEVWRRLQWLHHVGRVVGTVGLGQVAGRRFELPRRDGGRRRLGPHGLFEVDRQEGVDGIRVVFFQGPAQTGQVALQHREVLIAILRGLGEAPIHHLLEPGVEPWATGRERLGLAVDDGEHRRCEVALERLLVGEQLVQHGADGKDIAAVIHRLAGDLLRRHVVERANQHALLRAVGAAQLRDAEVEHLEHARRGDHQIGRLYVAVHEVRLVGVGQTRAQIFDELHAPGQRQRHLAADELGHGVAGHVFHRDVRTSLVRAVLVDRHDVRMRQLGDVARFFFKAPTQVVVVEAVAQQLDGHEPIESLVAREKHFSHAAGRNGLDHRVAGDVRGSRAHRPRLADGQVGTILA